MSAYDQVPGPTLTPCAVNGWVHTPTAQRVTPKNILNTAKLNNTTNKKNTTTTTITIIIKIYYYYNC